MFSTMMFSSVRKPSRGQCLNTPGLRLRGLLLPRNMVSRFGQQFAIRMNEVNVLTGVWRLTDQLWKVSGLKDRGRIFQ